MTNIKAAKILECMAVDLTGSMAGLSPDSPMVDVLSRELEAINVAQGSLRAQQEQDLEPYKVLRTEWETPESCPNCMEHLSLDWLFCPTCGRPTDWSVNEPLTLDELREMNGEFVWVDAEDEPEPVLMRVYSEREFVSPMMADECDFCDYGSGREGHYGWLAYCHRPKEGFCHNE